MDFVQGVLASSVGYTTFAALQRWERARRCRVYNVAFIDREEALGSVSRALPIFRRLHLSGAMASLYVVTTAAANSDPACISTGACDFVRRPA